MWAVELPDAVVDTAKRPLLLVEWLTGGLDSYPKCRGEARRWRRKGVDVLVAPSAALFSGGASGWLVDGGLTPGPARDGRVVVLFGRHSTLVGWSAAHIGQPDASLLPKVRPL
jgi:hypothetical protein